MSETTHDSADSADSAVGVVPPPSPDDRLTSAELAVKYGLSVSGARPSLPEYVRQLWARRHFILAFSRAKLLAQYSQAKLGQLWQVATPLLNAAVYFLIFGIIMGGREGIPGGSGRYIPFLVTGVFVFTFTQTSVLNGVRAISSNLGLVRALHFPRASLPISISLQQLQQLLFSMIVLVVILLGFREMPGLTWLLIVPVLACQFVFNTGLALIMARLGSKTPDLAQLMPFITRTWLYASGVMFSLPYMLSKHDAPHWLVQVMQANPATVYMDLMRYSLIDEYTLNDMSHYAWPLALVWAIVIGVGGFVFFWKSEERYGRG
ncbi:ABC transporter permease [Streptomyces cacaoi]|uniref:Transport permease protein n=1 Tax=Streptomyces cacaoi TaxID=1898 RepID=A0A4Y3QQM5_STRCI|nr:ABC transporter permease [Streptomyces cacaoi]NNG86064.1 ABC transporter permease [Streptomyces cacaoi]GEB47595.1 transport permease protein [Streptomyces cacaoi]